MSRMHQMISSKIIQNVLILLTISKVRGATMGPPITQSRYMPNTPIIPVRNSGSRYGEDQCNKNNQMVEGVYIVPEDNVSRKLEREAMVNNCMIYKAKEQELIKREMKQITEDAKRSITDRITKDLEKQTCVNKLDKSNHECYKNEVLSKFFTAPVWKAAIHDNVGQIWNRGKLIYMVALETIEYLLKPKDHPCVTYFPDSTVETIGNALGNVIKVVGKPNTVKMPNGGCRPCTDFLRGKKTVEGAGMKCQNKCDTIGNILFSNGNFKTQAPKPKPKPQHKSSKEEKKKRG